MVSEVLVSVKTDMQWCVDGLSHELEGIRTGRASTVLVEDIIVDYHGTSMPLKQLANISVPEPALIAIQPWDRTAIRAVEKAILKSNIGLNPSSDGTILRLAIPALNEERRMELAKMVGKHVEERKIALRNIRRDHVAKLKRMEKEKDISKDELDSTLKKVEDLTDSFVAKAGDIGVSKQKEIKEI